MPSEKKSSSKKSSTGSSNSDKELTPYRAFFTKKMAELKEKDPDGKFRDVINEMWKNSPENPKYDAGA